MPSGCAFDFVTPPPERSLTKPRKSGLTMMIDQGLGAAFQKDLLEAAAAYIDFAKFKTGRRASIRRRCCARRCSNIFFTRSNRSSADSFMNMSSPCMARTALPAFYAEARNVGFTTIEISDNVVPLTAAQRREQIRGAIDAGLEVFGEVGAKDRNSTAAELIDQAGDCFAAGATLVLVEAAELVVAGKPNREMIDELTRHLDMKRVMIELPGPWISRDVRTCDIEVLKKLLVAALRARRQRRQCRRPTPSSISRRRGTGSAPPAR